MKPIEIFRAGTHTAMSGAKVTITTADLAQCAQSYDRALHEAPLVCGHPKANAPAYGWVGSLSVQGDVLMAVPDQVEPNFAQMVDAGRFKKRSASFYAPNDPLNPTPGKFHLKHVGFLGAVPPAVYGLKEVEFAGADQAIEFADWQGLSVARLLGNLREFIIAQFGQDKADEILPSDDIDSLKFNAAQPDRTDDDGAVSPSYSQGEPVTDAEKALEADKTRLAAERLEFAQQQKTARRALLTVFVEGLITAGKLATGNKDPMIAFMAALPAAGDDATFEFAQADGKTAKVDLTDWFKGFLESQKPLITTKEIAPHKGGVDFAQGEAAGLNPGKIYAKHNAR